MSSLRIRSYISSKRLYGSSLISSLKNVLLVLVLLLVYFLYVAILSTPKKVQPRKIYNLQGVGSYQTLDVNNAASELNIDAASDVNIVASYVHNAASDVKNAASDVKNAALDVNYAASQFNNAAPNVKNAASDIKNAASNFKNPSPNVNLTASKVAPVSRYGKTVFGRNHLIIYNAIPKTGSRSLDSAVESSINVTLLPRSSFQNASMLENFARQIENPNMLRGHAMFFDLESSTNAVYINMIRDPIERLISNYYYDIYGDSDSSWTNRTVGYPKNINDCVARPKLRCNFAINFYQTVTLRQFCGTDPRCRKKTSWTFDQAMANLDRYTFVGLTDQMEDTVKILSKLFPDLLGRLYIAYKKHTVSEMRVISKTNKKVPPSNATIQHLRSGMQLEYNFHQIVQNKFELLKRKLLR